mgnify:FL=1
MEQSFQELCTLIDLFWQEQTYDKPGRKPDYHDDFYIKLYFFGLLFACNVKERIYPRACLVFPALFKKNRHPQPLNYACRESKKQPAYSGFGWANI